MRSGVFARVGFIGLVLARIAVTAQDYVITTSGDTLRGEVKLLGYLNPPKVQITETNGNGEQGDKKKKRKVLAIAETKRFVMEGETYDPVSGPEGIVFMKLEQEGYLSLYAYQQPGQLLYDSHMLVTRDGSRLPVPNVNFRTAMRSFLSECPDVVVKIEDKVYSRDDLPAIIDEYNDCIRKHTEDRRRAIAYREFYARQIAPWDTLQKHVESIQFEDRKDVLDMINDVKGKLKRSEPVPKFLLTTLREYLIATKLTPYLEKAIGELEKK